MKVVIVTPERKLFDAEADSLKVPGSKGRFEVLHRHAPIISSLTAGRVEVSGSEPMSVCIKGGFMSVAHDEALVCVEV